MQGMDDHEFMASEFQRLQGDIVNLTQVHPTSTLLPTLLSWLLKQLEAC